jgi:hypothetical protein
LAPLDITGGPHADPDDVFSAWKGSKEGIKGDDPIDLGRREIQSLGDPSLDLSRKVAADILAFL